jgi:hypothetical protein
MTTTFVASDAASLENAITSVEAVDRATTLAAACTIDITTNISLTTGLSNIALMNAASTLLINGGGTVPDFVVFPQSNTAGPLRSGNVIFAEGLAAESYLDTGNRGASENGDGALYRYPNFTQRVWDAWACAPQITYGPTLHAVRQDPCLRAKILFPVVDRTAGGEERGTSEGVHSHAS